MAGEIPGWLSAGPGEDLRLRRMKRIATGSLAAAAAVYVGLGFAAQSWPVAAARAAAEAAMVGGIADWFAVVSLFRRPFGLPIPRAGLIPGQKDRIGAVIGQFVQTHLLDPDEMARRIEGADFSAALLAWLEEEGLDRMAGELAAGLPGWLARIDDAWLRDRTKAALRGAVREADLAGAADAALAALLARGAHHAVIDAVAASAQEGLEAQRPRIEALIEAQLARFAGSYLRGSILDVVGIDPRRTAARLIPPRGVRDLADGVMREVGRALEAVRRPGSPTRAAVLALIDGRVADARASGAWTEMVGSLRADILDGAAFDRRFDALWPEMRARIGEALAGPGAPEAARLLGAAVRAVAADDALRASLNDHLRAAVRGLVLRYRSEVGSFVTDTVRGWDGATLAGIVEGRVGGDLQFVRINGTVVGAMVGLAIFVLGSLVAPA